MRRRFIIVVWVLAALVLPATAQVLSPQTASTALTGVNPRAIKNVPIDLSKAVVPMNIANSFRPPKQPSTFTLSHFFPKIAVSPWPPKMPNLFPKNNLTPSPINPQSAFKH